MKTIKVYKLSVASYNALKAQGYTIIFVNKKGL